MTEPWRLTARDAIALLKRGEVSPRELVAAAADRIAATEPGLNAMPTTCFERALAHAERLTDERGRSSSPVHDGPGALHGLPVSIKDLQDVAGVRTTYGSPIWARHVPKRSDIMVERLERRGGIVMGKTNVPEFGAGAVGFNEVLGSSANPWDMSLTPGGSSGGAAAGLAAGQVPLATGSDLGGSLRIPASFCGVVGFRPSPGIVARGPDPACFDDLAVLGPMARDVPDAALLLDAMAGLHGEDPLARRAPGRGYLDGVLAALDGGAGPRRIGYSPDLGVTPVKAEVDDACRRAVRSLSSLGAEISPARIDFGDAPEAFHTLRAMGFAARHGEALARHREDFKPEIVWNIEKGLALAIDEVLRAQRIRAALFHRVAAFFKDHDLLALPSTITPAFPMHWRYLGRLGDHRFDTYIDWIMITSVVSLTACPAISIPCAIVGDGLPVGLQLVGRPHGDAELLGWAAQAERLFGFARRVPIEPRGARGRHPAPEPGGKHASHRRDGG